MKSRRRMKSLWKTAAAALCTLAARGSECGCWGARLQGNSTNSSFTHQRVKALPSRPRLKGSTPAPSTMAPVISTNTCLGVGSGDVEGRAASDDAGAGLQIQRDAQELQWSMRSPAPRTADRDEKWRQQATRTARAANRKASAEPPETLSQRRGGGAGGGG